MSTIVDKWKGGDNLVLVDGVSCIAAKHVGRPEDMVKELLNFFTGDLKKTEILKSCLEKMRDVSDRFKTERRSSRTEAKVPTLQQVAADLREKKRKFLESTIGEHVLEITVCNRLPVNYTPADVQYLTPQKGLKDIVKTRTNQASRRAMITHLAKPLYSVDDLTPEEKAEAEALRQSLKKQSDEVRTENWADSSVEKENTSLTALVEIAFRALLAENVKKLEAYRYHLGRGDIRWDFSVKNLPTAENEVLYTARAAYAAKIIRMKEGDGLPPSSLLDFLESERVKYEWFVNMFTESKEASSLVSELEASLGQSVQAALLSSNEASHKMYVSLAEENNGVLEGTTSLFAFYRTKFSRLRAGEVLAKSKPTKASIFKVNHDDTLDEADMPEDVRTAYRNIFLTKPISKHPDGVAVSETQRQSEKTTVESVWKLKDDVDKVTKWHKQKGKPTVAFSADSDSDIDAKSPPKKQKTGEKKSAKKKDDKETDLEALNKRIHKLEARHGGSSNSQKPRDDSRPQGICYDFQNRGKCSRDKCKFSHDSKKDNNRRREPSRERDRDHDRGRYRGKSQERRPFVKVPDAACENLRNGKCDVKDCSALHGKFNKDSKRECWNEKDKKFCYSLFSEDGCNFLHTGEHTKN